MGAIKNGDHGGRTFISTVLLHCLHTVSLAPLTLLLPLSFLPLARLAPLPDLLAFPTLPPSTLVSILLNSICLLLHLLVPLICFTTLLHASVGYLPKPHVRLAWAILSIFQLTVGLGVEAAIVAGINKPVVDLNGVWARAWIQRTIFFMGVYETTLFWSKAFVRPVVDDAIFGAAVEETGTERVVVGVAFGVIWLGMLGDEVEGLVLGEGVGWHGVVCWLVGFVMVAVGLARVVRGILWMGKHSLLLFRGHQIRSVDSSDSLQIGNKV